MPARQAEEALCAEGLRPCSTEALGEYVVSIPSIATISRPSSLKSASRSTSMSGDLEDSELMSPVYGRIVRYALLRCV